MSRLDEDPSHHRQLPDQLYHPKGGAQNTGETVDDGSCRDYDDFFSRTRYTVPEGVLDENGRMVGFNNDLVIRYLDRVIVKDDGYEVVFKAGVTVEVEV